MGCTLGVCLITDVTKAIASMNTDYQLVAQLATRASDKKVITESLFGRVGVLSDEVKAVNDEFSIMNGWKFNGWINRAEAASEQSRVIATDLAAILNEPNPVPDRSTGGSLSALLALIVAGAAGYWIYKWVTEKELYPRHLVPEYAGGNRRGGR